MKRTILVSVLTLLVVAGLIPWSDWSDTGSATSTCLAQQSSDDPPVDSQPQVTPSVVYPAATARGFTRATPARPPMASGTTPARAYGTTYSSPPSRPQQAYGYGSGTYGNQGWLNPKSYIGLVDGGTDVEQFPTEQLRTDVDRWIQSRTQELARQLSTHFAEKGPGEEIIDTQKKLSKVILAHFDVRQEIRKREIKELETRVKKLREHLDKRAESRDLIAGTRLQQLITTAEGLGWDDKASGARTVPSGYGSQYPYPQQTPSYGATMPAYPSSSYQPAQTPTSPRTRSTSSRTTGSAPTNRTPLDDEGELLGDSPARAGATSETPDDSPSVVDEQAPVSPTTPPSPFSRPIDD